MDKVAGPGSVKSSSTKQGVTRRSPKPPTPINRAESPEKADLSVLFLGNSHTQPLPSLLEGLFGQHQPEKKVLFRMARGFGFLDQQSKSPDILREITEQRWDYVVLQAQKYSTTGKYDYPIDGAVKLAKLASENGSKVLLYPEFPRRGADEYQRIRAKHEAIAKESSATIAPIGEAWEWAEDQFGAEKLYAPDGNHASRFGSTLIASVFYSIVSNQDELKDSQVLKRVADLISEVD